MVPILDIKNQEKTDFCLGCVISSIAEQYVGEPCEESYSFAAGKKYSGQNLEKSGIPPKSAIMGAIRYGVLPKKHSPYGIATHSRDFLANWDNWKDLEHLAIKPFKSFYKVKVGDIPEKLNYTTLIMGLYWQSGWSKNPVITSQGKETWNKLAPHEVRVIDVKDDMLVIQNSRGKEKGDNGLWYLSKEVYTMIDHVYEISPNPWPNKLSELLSKYL